MEAGRIGKGKAPKIVLGYETVFNQFIGFAQNLLGFGNVPMADVGADHGIESGAETIEPGIECHRIRRVVGPTAEVELRYEAVLDVLGPGDFSGRPLVELAGVLRLFGP